MPDHFFHEPRSLAIILLNHGAMIIIHNHQIQEKNDHDLIKIDQ